MATGNISFGPTGASGVHPQQSLLVLVNSNMFDHVEIKCILAKYFSFMQWKGARSEIFYYTARGAEPTTSTH